MNALEQNFQQAEYDKQLREYWGTFILAAEYTDIKFRNAAEVMALGARICGAVEPRVRKKFFAKPKPDELGNFVIEPQDYLDAVRAMTAEQKKILRAGIQ
jgi:hypothetical protein